MLGGCLPCILYGGTALDRAEGDEVRALLRRHGARTARDQIDLYAVAAGVACENPPTARGEMTRCTRLSFGPEGQV